MTRSIQLHPLSVLVGLGIAVLALVTMGQSADIAHTRVAVVSPVLGPAHPRDFIEILEGAPYTVPAGRLFVVTALGRSATGGVNVSLFIDGVQKANVVINPHSMNAFPAGLAVPPGKVIEVTSDLSQSGQVWGYLVDE